MKNLFTFIVALFMATSVYAQKTATYCSTDGTAGKTSAGLSTLTFPDGAVLILNRNNKEWSSGFEITIDGNKKKTIKGSNGAQSILELPSPATKITLYSYCNKKQAEMKGKCYWKEINGANYNETNATILNSYTDVENYLNNPDEVSFTVDNVKKFTFNNAGTQLCFVIKVEYADENKVSSVTIGDAGFATHASKFAVDYSNRTDGLEAYSVSYNSSSKELTYTPINGVVEAGKAVILKGKGNYILEASSKTATVTETGLKASDGSIKGAPNIYCLANKTSNGVGFYQVKSDVTIPANKAYLEIATATPAKYYSIGIGGNTTGIQAIQQNSVKADGIMYSLSGQKVGENYKGIVICNGKKMIKK